MKRIAAIFLLLFAISGCATADKPFRETFTGEELDLQERYYKEADYFTLITFNLVEKIDGKWWQTECELSGFLISDKGKFWIATAGHMVEEGERIADLKVTFKNDKKRSFSAEVFYKDPVYDLILLRVKDGNFYFSGKTAKLGNSDLVKTGNWVLSLGHPDEHYWFYAPGRVSDLHFKHNSLLHIENTAYSGIGGSGGPLINKAGEVIGMTVMVRMKDNLQVSRKVLALASNIVKRAINRSVPRR